MGFRQLPSDQFYFAEFERFIDHRAICDVIRGAIAGCIFRGVLPRDACDRIARNFDAISEVQMRADGVPGRQLGTCHYKKSTADYFTEVDRSASTVEALFVGTSNPVEELRNDIATAIKKDGYVFRSAQHRNHCAARCIARQWTDPGQYSLLPHEDVAQLQCANQSDFEIQKVTDFTVVGANLCIEKTCQGADLQVWNMIPDHEMRSELRVTDTGYPYPYQSIADVPNTVVEVRVGDVYLLNGSCSTCGDGAEIRRGPANVVLPDGPHRRPDCRGVDLALT